MRPDPAYERMVQQRWAARDVRLAELRVNHPEYFTPAKPEPEPTPAPTTPQENANG